MSTLVEDGVPTMSDAHRRVLRIVENMGIRVMDEVPFPPFQVDIYVPRAHAAIEVDGPQHQPGRDAKKDQILSDRYLLPVLRIKAGETVENIINEVRAFVDWYALTKESRWDEAKDALPHL